MTWTNRVLWREGMFLRAQHFQQQDRFADQVGRARLAAIRAHAWGVTSLSLDRDLLATGRFALLAAEGLFEDGTPFVIPRDADHPPPLEVPPNTRNAVVYLSVPIGQAGAQEVAAEDTSEARWDLANFEAYDTHTGSPQPAELQVGRLRLRYLLETESRAGFYGIGLARIQEVAADRRITLDERWIAPALLCSAVQPLSGLISEFAGLLNQRGEALAGRLAAPGQHGVAEVQDFLALQAINRWQGLLAHWADSARIHPEVLYETFVQMAGEFATFYGDSKRPRAYPSYRHEDLQRSFAPVVADLRLLLAKPVDSNAIPIPLRRASGAPVWVGQIVDRSILSAVQFVLVVNCELPTEQVQRLLPQQIKIGSTNTITQLVNVQLPGIPVRPLPVAPRVLPFYAGAVYFDLERNAPYWQQMQQAPAFAIHISGEFPGLRMELWAIRGA
ncbi:MAG TPA: type VI secretion system baseplate subunit TssK [Acetobacteraceae bacterium]|nr:type VI secretion system baseplate subunit TssK [Acetobacteraceae bacterium]